MKTNMTDSSLIAHEDGLATGRFSVSEQKIVDALAGQGWMSRKQISKLTGLEPGSVAGRCNRLAELGVIDVHPETKTCPISKRAVRFVRLAETQLSLL